jgi:hypothetical protein
VLTALIVVEVILFFLIAASVENEGNDFWAIAGTILATALAFFITSVNPIDWLHANFNNVLIGVVGWFAVGAGWSAFKWWRFFRQDTIAAAIKDAHDIWLKRSEPKDPFGESYDFEPFRLTRNKARITRWIVFWPASVLWTCTYRLIRKVVAWVWDAMKAIYSSIAASETKRILSK